MCNLSPVTTLTEILLGFVDEYDTTDMVINLPPTGYHYHQIRYNCHQTGNICNQSVSNL